MKRDVEAYLLKQRLIPSDQCSEIIADLAFENVWREYPYDSPSQNICVTENPEIAYYDARLPEDHDVSKFIQEKIKKVGEEYVTDFLADLPWFSYLTGNSQAHYIKYPTGSGMDTHCDHVRNQFDGTKRGIPILTALCMLNDNYEGGELKFWEDTYIKPKAGEIIMFPSNFLYPHKVMPVTKGTRYSFVVWLW
jgi:predicted 2-oxoglutarate/Fe(II)-dependent dioxygenase YbiX